MLFLVANLGFELSLGVYNGFLPEIAREDNMGRVSAYGFALGYLGGGLALVWFWPCFLRPTAGTTAPRPRSERPAAQAGPAHHGPLVGPVHAARGLLAQRPQDPTADPSARLIAVRSAISQVGRTLANVRHYRSLAIFLVAFLLYNDGVQTVISQASVFAKKVLQMETGELVLMILMIQFAAMPGAWIVGWLADRIGQKPTLSICLAVWSVTADSGVLRQTNVSSGAWPSSLRWSSAEPSRSAVRSWA